MTMKWRVKTISTISFYNFNSKKIIILETEVYINEMKFLMNFIKLILSFLQMTSVKKKEIIKCMNKFKENREIFSIKNNNMIVLVKFHQTILKNR